MDNLYVEGWVSVTYLVIGLFWSGVSFSLAWSERCHSRFNVFQFVWVVVASWLFWPFTIIAFFNYTSGPGCRGSGSHGWLKDDLYKIDDLVWTQGGDDRFSTQHMLWEVFRFKGEESWFISEDQSCTAYPSAEAAMAAVEKRHRKNLLLVLTSCNGV